MMRLFPSRMFVVFILLIGLGILLITKYEYFNIPLFSNSVNSISTYMEYYPEAEGEEETIFDLWDKISDGVDDINQKFQEIKTHVQNIFPDFVDFYSDILRDFLK